MLVTKDNDIHQSKYALTQVYIKQDGYHLIESHIDHENDLNFHTL